MYTYSRKSVEVVMINCKSMLDRNPSRNPAIKKLFRDGCAKDFCGCRKCLSSFFYNETVMSIYGIVEAQRCCIACKKITCKCAE
ncbi:hypothetical protein ALC62_13323 [Cyphomyrmex costatus]|uniref:Uncharacterized protein n=1 Tax=Cyphomyrmex costatus TaxID=456900 RepID=A0A151IA18_9HYME|nr:hypothetical protein ALC62_13323 [Cyphomyrmex costatus]